MNKYHIYVIAFVKPWKQIAEEGLLNSGMQRLFYKAERISEVVKQNSWVVKAR